MDSYTYDETPNLANWRKVADVVAVVSMMLGQLQTRTEGALQVSDSSYIVLQTAKIRYST